MTTSGTVATTTIDTATVLEHAFRRVRVHPSKQTPEKVDIASQNLYLLLLSLSSRGLNLWCIESVLQGLVPGQPTYATPAGTIDVLNVTFSTPQLVDATFSATANGGKVQIAATDISRIGILPSASFTGALTVSSSSNDVSYTTLLTTAATKVLTAGVWSWIDLPVTTSNAWFKVESTGLALSNMRVASTVRDLPVVQWNRDVYAVINNKRQEGSPSTNYYLEKLLTPQITLWPVPSSDSDHLTLFLHRQVQDVGTLTQQLELPQRWVEAIIWQLAVRLAFELEEVDPAIITAVTQTAENYLSEAELNETDGAPIRLAPNIRGYSA